MINDYRVDSHDKIKNYNTLDDKIIITFFDGSNYVIPLNDENIKKQKFNAIIYILINSGMSIFNIMNFIANNDIYKILFGIASSVFCINVFLWGRVYKAYNNDYKKIKKYELYLKMAPKLEEYNLEKELNVNTIDEYSLSYVKRVRKKLKIKEKKEN